MNLFTFLSLTFAIAGIAVGVNGLVCVPAVLIVASVALALFDRIDADA